MSSTNNDSQHWFRKMLEKNSHPKILVFNIKPNIVTIDIELWMSNEKKKLLDKIRKT